jgi:maltose/moltooligosaccharide transporter
VLKNFLGNDSGNAVVFAGILLALAALATLLIKSESTGEEVQLSSSSH